MNARFLGIFLLFTSLIFVGGLVPASAAAPTILGPEYTLTKIPVYPLQRDEKRCEYFLWTKLGGAVQRVSFGYLLPSGKTDSDTPRLENVTRGHRSRKECSDGEDGWHGRQQPDIVAGGDGEGRLRRQSDLPARYLRLARGRQVRKEPPRQRPAAGATVNATPTRRLKTPRQRESRLRRCSPCPSRPIGQRRGFFCATHSPPHKCASPSGAICNPWPRVFQSDY